MENNIPYDTAFIAFLAALICGPLIFSKGIMFLFVGLAVIALAICNYLPIETYVKGFVFEMIPSSVVFSSTSTGEIVHSVEDEHNMLEMMTNTTSRIQELSDTLKSLVMKKEREIFL